MSLNEEIEPSVALENVTAISAEAPLKMRENEILRMSLRSLAKALAELAELKKQEEVEPE